MAPQGLERTKMKYLILLPLLLLSCEATQPTKEPTPNNPAPIIVDEPKTNMDLAWAKEPKAIEWNYYLDQAMASLPSNATIKTPCKKLSLIDCSKQLLSIMAKYESSYKTEESYKEGFSDSQGKAVISRGLFQISQESANQSAYGCKITDAKQLHDPKTNINCAVKILSYQAKKHGVLIDGSKAGCGAYWSVCRKTSGSYAKIMKYMEQF